MSMSGEGLDKQRVRRGFERAAARYEGAAFLAREVGARMGERLDLLRAIPQTALDLGSGTGFGARMLRERYPACVVVEMDFAFEMLLQSQSAASWWQRGLQRLKRALPPRVCGDAERLPFRDRAFGMVWSNLTLHWTHLPSVFAQVYRVLRPGGVFMFSALGPDTLKELRAAYAEADRYGHVNRFVDLHDVGDLLVAAGFADPVMDMEMLTLTYDDVDALLGELRAAGARNANVDRPVGLSGRKSKERMRSAYERYRKDGRLPATFEVVYGHAWRPEVERRTAAGEAVIEFHPRRGGEH
jgi:malonyl-CoA O-methyltransferase